MGRCHVLMIFFFFFSTVHLLSISSFLKFVPVRLFLLGKPSIAEGFSSNLEMDHRKWESCVNKSPFQWVMLVFSFKKSTCHSSFGFPIVIRSQMLPSSCSSLCHRQRFKVIYLHVIHSQMCPYLSHAHILLIFLHVMSWHFVLTWLLSLSLSRRGVIWRSCVHGTGFCD